MLGRHVALTDRGIQAGDIGVTQLAGQAGERAVGHQPLERQTLFAHGLGDVVLACVDGFLAALFGEPLPNLVAGAGTPDERQPVARGPGPVGL